MTVIFLFGTPGHISPEKNFLGLQKATIRVALFLFYPHQTPDPDPDPSTPTTAGDGSTPLPPLPAATAAVAVATATSIPSPTRTPSTPPPPPRDAASAAAHDDLLPPKLRLMCSFGGHIIPRPHDKSLCYVGGETRIVVVDRHACLADLSARLSGTLLRGRPFALKYQLPSEELDSLISVTNDEDLLNMIDEYDRAACPSSSPLRPSRLRLFLFFTKPETATSMGTLLDDSKSETWFVDALNNAGILPRGISDSATTMDCLVNLDPSGEPQNDLEAQVEDHHNNNAAAADDGSGGKQVKAVQDVHFAMPDSPVVENSSSSYGSSSSSPSMSNLPPIRVRVDQRGVGIEDQFAHMSIAAAGHPYRHDDIYGAFSAQPPPFPAGIMASVAASAGMANQAGACGDSMSSRGPSDDERSDQGAPPAAFRKPPLPMLQTAQAQPPHQKSAAAYNLPSPDSVASDSSIASACSLSRPMYYEDQAHAGLKEQRSGAFSPTDPADPAHQPPIPQAADPGYAPPPPSDHLPPLPPQPQQPQQQQYVHMSTHYIPHPHQHQHQHQSQSPVLVSSYYPVYQTQSQQQQQLHHPVYMMPDGSMVGQARPLPSSSPAGGYKDLTPPIYHSKAPAQVTPEMASGMYSSYMASPQQLIQVSAGQYQQQHPGMMAQINQQPQTTAAAATPAAANNYAAFDYSYSAQDLAYFAQHQASVMPPQYQNLATAAGTMADAPKQPSGDIAKQQIMTSQQL
ncbi:trithorax group protein osa-like [Eucalyptus grandis]|uniref:trithorax group protein osa-like n=1 Tax=Eucalyptus grandis TaxID=71139 RepID=UPI00192EF1D4|nr:trithorax group protein osa-like [Eucalyptus grandis]